MRAFIEDDAARRRNEARLQLAAAALPAVIANPNQVICEANPREWARRAVSIANAVLRELDEAATK